MKPHHQRQRKKALLTGAGTLLASLMLAGCAGYQGVANYDSKVELSRENEKLTGETVELQVDKGQFKIEKVQNWTFEQNLRIDSRKGTLYTEGSGGQCIANCICYPFVLVLSPLRLLGMGDKIQKEFGHEYVYSSGRQTWNMFNPFICTLGDLKLEEETLSSTNKKESCSETRRIPVKEGKIQLIFGKEKKEFPVSVTFTEIAKNVFDYPLPEKTEKISVAFGGKEYPLTLKSSDLLTAEEKAAWNAVVNAKTADQAMKGNVSASLEKLHQEKKISDAIYKTEKNRLDGLAEDLKFPMRALSDNRAPLSKEYVSGLSLRWVAQMEKEAVMAANNNPKKGLIKLFEARMLRSCDEIRYNSVTAGILVFSPGEKLTDENTKNAVLVRREIEMPSTVSFDAVVEGIVKKNPGVKGKKSADKQKIRMADGTLVTVFDKEAVIANEKTRWVITQRKFETGFTDSIKVVISDPKLEAAFEKIKAENRAKERAKEEKKKQQAQQEALDQL